MTPPAVPSDARTPPCKRPQVAGATDLLLPVAGWYANAVTLRQAGLVPGWGNG